MNASVSLWFKMYLEYTRENVWSNFLEILKKKRDECLKFNQYKSWTLHKK